LKHPVFQAKITKETGEAISLTIKLTGFKGKSHDIARVFKFRPTLSRSQIELL
jgi:hypothetical protein